MKINDLVIKQINEAPMGALKNIGNRAAAAFGSGKAQGRLETGQIANQLKKEFDQYLGKTGQEATGEMVLQFLKSKKIPTASAAKAIGIPDLAPEQPAAAPAETPPEQPAAQDQSAEQPAAQPAPTTPEQPAAQDSNVVDTDKLKPQTGPGNRKSGDIIKVGANTLQWTGTPGQEWFIASGPLSEPNPQTDRFTGVVSVGGKRFISADNAKAKLQAESKKRLKKGLFETYLRYFRILKEALTDKQLDAMFLAAAQEQAAQPAQPSAQPAQALSTGQKVSAAASGAAAGIDQAMGQVTGTRSSVGSSAGSAAASILDDLDVPTLKNALKSAVAGQPVQDEQQKIELSKLLKKL